jgi:hypothetical protein
MSNDTEKQNDKQELNNWQKLHKQLDDRLLPMSSRKKPFPALKQILSIR